MARMFSGKVGLAGVIALCLSAAGPTGTIIGTVKDPSGGVIPGANVVVRNEETNISRAALTNEIGEYYFPLLSPGLYEITVTMANFRQAIQSGVKLGVSDTVRVDVAMQLGDVREVLTLSSVPPLIQMDSSSNGQIIDRQRIANLPLNERNFLHFTLLAPGAQLPSDGSQNSTFGATVSVNGIREQSNNFLLDGVDNNDVGLNQYSALPSVEAIQEFRVQTNNSSAEFGRSGGAQINVILKSGTNNLHGTVFGFLRNRHLDARNFFDKPSCKAASPTGSCGGIPRLDRNQFGGAGGGPVRRDKTFFFVSYEGLRLRQAVTREASVPSQAQRAAALAAVPVVQRNPAGAALLQVYPAANVGSDLLTSNRFVGAPVQRNGLNQFLIKLDHRVSENVVLSGHYSLSDENRYNAFDPFLAYTSLPGFGTFIQTRGQNAGIDWTHIVSTRAVNSARFGFNRDGGAILQEHYGNSFNQRLGFPDVFTDPIAWGFPNVVVSGFDAIGEPINTPNGRGVNTFHFADTLAWIPSIGGGRHRLSIGADIRRVQLNFYLGLLSRGVWHFVGAFTGDPLQDLLRGLPVVAIAGQGHTGTGMRTTHMNYFVQDDIQLHPRFTLNLGVRYEYNSPPVEIHNRLSVPDLSARSATCTPQPDCAFLNAGTAGIPRAIFNSDLDNVAPRVGFAWRPFVSDRIVVRSAYGIFYDVPIMNFNVGPRLNPPFFRTAVYANSGTNTIQDIMRQGNLPVPAVPFLIAGDFRDPYIQHWTFDLQHAATPSLVLQAAYVGTKGTSLINRRNPNQPRPGGLPPYPQFGPWQYYESGSSSTYHSLQLRAERRFGRGLTFLAAFTLSNSIDNASALFNTAAEPAFPQDSHNMRVERGLSNFNARRRLVASYVYELPFGKRRRSFRRRWLQRLAADWQLAGILTMQSGRPFTVNRVLDQSGTGTNLIAPSDRPDQLADPFAAGPVANHPDRNCQSTVSQGGRAADIVRDPANWFNPCAFAAAPGRFGTAGRNSVIGPTLRNWDFALIRNLSVRDDKHWLQVRFEAFNLPNHPNFDLPDRVVDSATFGQVRSANAFGTKPPRQIQLGLKYIF